MSLLRPVPEPRSARPQDSAFANGVEITVTLALFVAGGLWVDSRIGSTPWVTVLAAVFALVGQFVRTYYSYNSRMRELERERRESTGAAGRGHDPGRSGHTEPLSGGAVRP